MDLKNVFIIVLSLFFSLPLMADSRTAIEVRIKPIGQVQIAGDDSTKIKTSPEEEVVTAPAAMSGEDVYKKFCVVCHAAGVAGAPKVHDKTQWAARQSKGVEGLLKTAISGLNAMPAKGTCMACSNDELKAAIEYMLPN